MCSKPTLIAFVFEVMWSFINELEVSKPYRTLCRSSGIPFRKAAIFRQSKTIQKISVTVMNVRSFMYLLTPSQCLHYNILLIKDHIKCESYKGSLVTKGLFSHGVGLSINHICSMRIGVFKLIINNYSYDNINFSIYLINDAVYVTP